MLRKERLRTGLAYPVIGSVQEEEEAKKYLADEIKEHNRVYSHESFPDIEQFEIANKDIIDRYGYVSIRELYDLCRYSGSEPARNFIGKKYGTIVRLREAFGPEFADYWPGIYKIVLSAGRNASLVLEFLHDYKTLLRDNFKDYWPVIVKLSMAADDETLYESWTGLPGLLFLNPVKSKGELETLGFKLLEISNGFEEKELHNLYTEALPAFGRGEVLFKAGMDLRKLGLANREHAAELFETGIGKLKAYFDNDFKAYWPVLVELGLRSGKYSHILFGSAIPFFKKQGFIRSKGDLERVTGKFVELAEKRTVTISLKAAFPGYNH